MIVSHRGGGGVKMVELIGVVKMVGLTLASFATCRASSSMRSCLALVAARSPSMAARCPVDFSSNSEASAMTSSADMPRVRMRCRA